MRLRALAATLAAGLTLGTAAPATAEEPPRTISVSGAAAATVPNDTARFVFGVRAERATAAGALRATAGRLRRVIAGVVAQGVPSADVVTTDVFLSRVTVPAAPGSARRVVRYVAVDYVRVTVRRVDAAGRVLDAAVQSGATSVSGPVFSPGDVGAVYRTALVSAFDEARDKARRLAAQAGVTLGAPMSIREGAAPTLQALTPPQPSLPNTVERRRVARTPVRPGTTRVHARVAVVFAIS